MAERPLTIVAHNGAAIFGGAERWTVRLLERLQDRGHRVLFLCRDEEIAERAEDFGVSALVARVGGHIALHHSMTFARTLRRIRPDGLLLSTFKKTWLAGLGARFARVPRVVARIGLSTDRPARNVLYRIALRHWVHRVVVNADGLREGILHDLPGLAPERVVTIYNGAEPTTRRREPGAVRRELGLGPDARVVGTVARLAEQKRLDRLVRALKDLPAHVHVVIAGEGPERAKLEEAARAENVADRVHLLGHREDVGDVLDALDVFTVTSVKEGMSNAMLEALAAGVPVVSTPVSGAAEALDPVDDGREPGWIVEPSPGALADAVGGLLADGALRRGMGEAGRRRARERFDWERKARAWEELLGRDVHADVHEGPSPLRPPVA